MKKNPLSSSNSEKQQADNGTVNRVLRILLRMGERESWGLNELARALDLPRASTHRLLGLCRPLNFVTQDEDGQYRAGLELYRLAGMLSAQMPINRVAAPILGAVRDAVEETTMLTLLAREDLRMFFSLTASPPHPMRYTIETNQLQPLSWGATGRVLLAHLSAEEIEEVIARREPSTLDGREMDERELRNSLAEIREKNYAITVSQRTPDAVGIAVPFFNSDGDVKGNIAITVPDFRFKPEREAELVSKLRSAVRDLTRGMGWA